MAKNSSFEEAVQADPRFRGASVGQIGEPNDSGVVMVEDKGDGLVLVTDRDGRKFVETLGDKPVESLGEGVVAKAKDIAIDNSPVVNEADPRHSDYDGRDSIPAVEPDERKAKVVNKDLGVDQTEKSEEGK